MSSTISDSNSAPAAPRGWRLLWWSLAVATGSMLVSLLFFSPRLWALRGPQPGSTYWDRGLQFVAQVDAPLGAPLADGAMTWRLAPVILAKTLGLHGHRSFVVPWLGLFALLAASAALARRRGLDATTAALLTALVATTAAATTVTGWLGMNDAWFALALLAVAWMPGPTALVLACALGPWIDERFLFALPLALWLRLHDAQRREKTAVTLTSATACVLAYAGVRLANPFAFDTGAMPKYWHIITDHGVKNWLPWVSLGWFMSLRTAWVLVAAALVTPATLFPRRLDWIGLGLMLASGGVVTVLASDSGRTPTMFFPLLLLGALRLTETHGAVVTRRLLLVLLAANLLLPAMHVTAKHGDIINSLPIEIVRLLQQPKP